ncbi:MAG: PDZ domain-containing protein [Chloroflexi bacterium]|nr:PDZ domain-containing protein [Chloroflexota bacterium]
MAEMLQNLSNDLAATVEAAGQSIVRIEARRRQTATGVVYSADGLIVTTHHVVERDDNITVGLPDGTSVAATLVGRDPTTDIAVLRAQANGLTPATWAELDAMAVGHMVLAIGRPGRTLQATLGIISALGESYRTGAGGQIDAYVQTDVVMYPGFSGGPLVSAGGQMLGLNTSALMRGVSLTLPTPTIRRVAETLMTHGKVRRGYLGVSAQPVKLPENIAQSSGQEHGLLVAAVEPNSPAANGGLMLGDTMLTFDGNNVQQMDDLLALLHSDRVGSSVPVRVVRGGEIREIQVMVGERN